MSSDKYSKVTATLPPDFVNHLRAVFDKLDKGNNGYIKITDLEKYWKAHYHLDESVTNSPIIKRLNEIAPANMGLVSFPRLCTGVKEALMQSKTHKNRKVSFLYALSIADDHVDTPTRNSYDYAVDENNNINVMCYSPPTSPKSPRPIKDFTSEDMEVQKLLDNGLELLTQLKSWYSRRKSKIYNCEIDNIPRDDIEKISSINVKLHKVLAAQRSKSKLLNGSSQRGLPDQSKISNGSSPTSLHDQSKISNSSSPRGLSDQKQKQELNDLKDKVLKLESEKSLLIRELFQLKAQMSPSNKIYMIDV